MLFCPCSKGSVVSALETQFDKKNPHEVEDRVTDVLTTVVKSGSLPTPPGEHFTPVETVKTALPQVAVISDGATGMLLYIILMSSCSSNASHLCTIWLLT